MKKKILFIENNDSFRRANAQLLRLEGYDVTEAPSLEVAEDLLSRFFYHMLICDIRMRDDDEKLDITGLELAKDSVYGGIPKIILTGYPEQKSVQEALQPEPDTPSPAVRFLTKDGSPGERIEKIKEAFELFSKANWDLVISSITPQSLNPQQIGMILFPGLNDEVRASRVEELTFLFAKQFQNASEIQLGNPCWDHDGMLAMTVCTFSEDRPRETLLAVCGSLAGVRKEREGFEKFAPSARRQIIGLIGNTDGIHFGLNIFSAPHIDLGKVTNLAQIYPYAGQKNLEAIFVNLFDRALAEWGQNQRKGASNGESLGYHYREKLKLDRQRLIENLSKKEDFLEKNAPILGLNLTIGEDKINVSFAGESHEYANPFKFFGEELLDLPVVLANSPGILSMDTILCDEKGKVCFTRFSDGGFAPQLWGHTSLEASIRFDGTNLEKIKTIQELETVLNSADLFHIDPSEQEQEIQKPIRTILSIRRTARNMVNKDPRAYLLGIFYQAIARVAAIEPDRQRGNDATRQLFHAYLAAAMTSSLLLGIKEPAGKGIILDPKDHRVIVDGENVVLRKNRYKLMVYLYEKSPNFCSRQELGEHLWGPTFDAMVQKDITRLNTNINRLRDDIDDDARNPKYLLTDEGGYRLKTS